MNGKLGTLDAIIYFVNHRNPAHHEGFVMLAPYSDCPTPEGYSREYADTLSAVDRLQATLLEQERREWEREAINDEMIMGARQREIVDRLRQRMCSSSTTPYERDFIAAYLQLREEKRDKYRQRFSERTAYLNVLAHETPRGRRPNEERVNLDRMELK